MKHLAVLDYGTFLGTNGERLVVKHEGNVVKELPLNRLSTVSVLKNGVSFSSDLLLNCGARGIKFFIFDEYAREVVCLSGGQLHAVVKVREAQFNFLQTDKKLFLSKIIIEGKIKNQKAVLQYFKKYLIKKDDAYSKNALASVEKSILMLQNILINIHDHTPTKEQGISPLLGFEGSAARSYFNSWVESKFFPQSFKGREGRGAQDIVNQMLNYGYAILSSYVWHCSINAGLEIYDGFLHTQRAGKPSLILDLMEEYRPWVVDRSIIKLRDHINNHDTFSKKLRGLLIEEIQSSFEKKHQYKGCKITLESLLQRQIYRLVGHFNNTKTYKPHVFKW